MKKDSMNILVGNESRIRITERLFQELKRIFQFLGSLIGSLSVKRRKESCYFNRRKDNRLLRLECILFSFLSFCSFKSSCRLESCYFCVTSNPCTFSSFSCHYLMYRILLPEKKRARLSIFIRVLFGITRSTVTQRMTTI